MKEAERQALATLQFNWAPTPDDVWRPAPFHVEGLHAGTERTILDGLAAAIHSDGSSPIGVAVLGQRGSGKTHLLGWVRQQVHEAGGYFFLIELRDASTFWRSAALSMAADIAREPPGQPSQLHSFLRRLAELVRAPRSVRRAVTGEAPLTRLALDAFVDLLRKVDRQAGMACQNTLRALVLQAAEDFGLQDIGYHFLCGNDEEEPGERAAWGIRRVRQTPQDIVRELAQVLALTGPSVIAVDQIDLVVAQSVKATSQHEVGLDPSPEERWRQALVIEQIAGGLMALRESTRRTLSVVSCLPATWEEITSRATDTVQDRFREAMRLRRISTPELGEQIVARRFAEGYTRVGFEPPYPTWPVLPEAFAEAVQFTPRELLITVDAHIRGCLREEQVRELRQLVRVPGQQASADRRGLPEAELAALDQEFAARREAADAAPALDPRTEDEEMPPLLHAGLTAWVAQQDDETASCFLDPPPGRKPVLHARLRRSLDDTREDEIHWCFRAIAATHPVAALNRIRNAITAAGLTEGVSKRRLFVLRNAAWSAGRRTTEVVEAFVQAGGERLTVPAADIRTLVALRDMLADRGLAALRPWLVARQPAAQVECLRRALAAGGGAETGAGSDAAATSGATTQLDSSVATPGEPSATAPGEPPASTGGLPAAATGAASAASVAGGAGAAAVAATGAGIAVGEVIDGSASVTVDLAALRRHTVIIAGSGSGKTVLIRRLVEECARQGVSAIVLDSNNDLSRLGDPWPEAPAGWAEGDSAAAADYLAHTDVVVWTPGQETGRPLTFQPLPDFSSVRDHPDEFQQAVEAAVAALAPRARVDSNTKAANLGQAVLREALRYYGQQGGGDLREFIKLLASLPTGVSELDSAGRLGGELAETLTAARVNDRLFAGDVGEPVDPGVLLTAAEGKRARVSVISFIGLPTKESQQSFVNQLQLALFAWIKRHPAGDRPLGGLLVMDEAQTLAPAVGTTTCTRSTIALASQARKYGLGLVFATQTPKGLHNQVVGNAATQFFGLLNAPAQIAAAKEIARAKGGDVPDIANLPTGQFYAAIEGAGFVRMQAPMCLSHHPPSAPTNEEVLARATAAAAGVPG